ncbi:Tag1p [Lachancea thermotolerans CBS 6340]|uniref:KLTH0H11726p n=1 Tax=Lachancea thermotolerans (strain ATCC 56472 / CBS 6340 / NRRL Y-8284) TaxID=559295 RepID=C5E3A6_LACTC|nr:KLTH0H11726p [Lachancea thermotolerans CBS 6340]CAR30517.1 KLTH0H11726p [Lachancea thermotolerans CBS 6340]
MESQDLEEQPLLRPEPHYEATSPPPQKKTKTRRRGWTKLIWGFIIILLLHAGVVLWAARYIPSQQLIQDYYEDATNVKLRHLAFDGWYSDSNGSHIENEDSPKYLKLRAQLDVWFDYDQVHKFENSSASVRKQRTIRFMSQSVVKSLCFDFDSIRAFNDNETDSQDLGTISIPTRTCIDVRHQKVNQLDVPILIRPDAKNVASVIMKIWKGEFKKLDLWSSLNVRLSKKVLNKWDLPLWKLKIARLDWKQFLNLDSLSSKLDSIRAALSQAVEVQSLEITDDVENDMNFRISVAYIVPEEIRSDMIFPQDSVFPPTSWNIQLPGCDPTRPVSLENALFRAPAIRLNDLAPGELANMDIVGNIQGPLPDDLLYQVCSSDEENVVTPVNLLLNKIFNATELLQFEILGHGYTDSQGSILPPNFMDQLLPSIQQPINANLSLNSNNLVEYVTVEGMRLRWIQSGWDERKLTIKGKVIAVINLPYYNSAFAGGEETVAIEKIKGLTKLFHNDVHFVNVPMDVWLNAESEFLPTEDPKHNQLSVSFDIAHQDVEIVNSFELTRCLNEILIRGQAQVHVEGKLDLMADTKLGAIVVLGLEGEGTTIVKK